MQFRAGNNLVLYTRASCRLRCLTTYNRLVQRFLANEEIDVSNLLERSRAAKLELEECILELLGNSPSGLRNAQIADALDLRSDFDGRQKDYLSYSLLGGLLKAGKIDRDQRTKLFTVSDKAKLPV